MSEMTKIILAAIIPMIIILIIGKPFISFLGRLKAGQSIREEGPKSHMNKAGTPVMGGIMTLGVAMICMLLLGEYNINEISIIMISTIGFGFVGFCDDYIKIVKKRNLGLKAKQKMLGQIIVAVLLVLLAGNVSNIEWLIPFSNGTIELGVLGIPILLFVIIGTVNSTNLTDGLDGLLSSVSLIVFLNYALLAYRLDLFACVVFSLIMTSVSIGFLFFNWHPAKVFMGDVGSLGIGGAVIALAIITKSIFFLPIIGGIFFIETVSVILQVIHFKRTGERIFKMAPIHHHYEMCGWREKKVVYVFTGITVILAIISQIAL